MSNNNDKSLEDLIKDFLSKVEKGTRFYRKNLVQKTFLDSGEVAK